jgi:CRP-like cAMP-binding protein
MAKVPLGMNHHELFAAILGDRADSYFPAGSQLFTEGAPADYAIYIIRGLVSVRVSSAENKHVVVAERSAGELIGEMSLVTGVRCATVLAIDPTETLKVPHAAIAQLINSRPDFALALYSLATERLYESNRALALCQSARDEVTVKTSNPLSEPHTQKLPTHFG